MYRVGRFGFKKAVSLTELIVASGIAAGVVVGAMIIVSNIADSNRSANVFNSLQNRVTRAHEVLQSDIEQAVRITGSTKAKIASDGAVTGYAGLMRLNPVTRKPAEPRLGTEDYDLLQIIRYVSGTYAAEINPSSHTFFDSPLSGYFQLIPPSMLGENVDASAEEFNVNVLRYVYGSLDNYDRAIVSNALGTNYLETVKADPEDEYTVGWLPVSESSFLTSDFEELRTTMTPATLVMWFVNGKGELIRREWWRNTGSQLVVARKVTRFITHFNFLDQRLDKSLELVAPAPGTRLSHPRDPAFIEVGATNEYGQAGTCVGENCCDPETETCVSFEDTSQAYVEIVSGEQNDENFIQSAGAAPDSGSGSGSGSGQGSGGTIDPSASPHSQLGFTPGDNYSFFGELAAMNPFSALTGKDALESAGQDISCTVNNPDCRCHPDTAHLYNNPIFGTPDWEGYGRHVDHENPSSYCLCGTGGDDSQSGGPDTFVPPETAEGRSQVPKYKGVPGGHSFVAGWEHADNFRIVQCAKFTGGLSTYAWKWKWKVHSILNNAFDHSTANPDDWDKLSFVSSSRDPSTADFTWNPEAFDEFYDAWLANADTNWQLGLKCRLNEDYNDREWRETLKPYDQESIAGRAPLPTKAQPWVEYCGCQPGVGKGSHPEKCYNQYAAVADSKLQCDSWEGDVYTDPDTGIANQKLWVLGDTFPTVQNAALCSCLDSILENPASPDDPETNFNVPVSHGHNYSLYWDFRADVTDYAEGWTAETFPFSGTPTRPSVDLTASVAFPASHSTDGGNTVNFLADQKSNRLAGGQTPYYNTASGQRNFNPGSWLAKKVRVRYRPTSGADPEEAIVACEFGNFSKCYDPSFTFEATISNAAARQAAYDQIRPDFKPAAYGGNPGNTVDMSSLCHSQCNDHRAYDPDSGWPGGPNWSMGRHTRLAEMKMVIACHKSGNCGVAGDAPLVTNVDDLPEFCKIRDEDDLGGAF